METGPQRKLLAFFTGLATLSLLLWSGLPKADAATCGYPNGPNTGTFTVVGNEYKACSTLQTLTPAAEMVLTLSNMPAGSQIANGQVPSFCVDLTGNILDTFYGNIQYTADFWSSLDPNLPNSVKQVSQGAKTYTIPWDKINFMLNTYPNENWLNLQAAYWDVVHGCTQLPGALYTCDSLRPAPYYFPYGPGSTSTYGCPSVPNIVDETRVQAIVADANAHGGGFTPQAGDRIASVAQITDCKPSQICNQYLPYQVIFTPTTCPTCTGTIGDFVWEDLNGNGIQDAGEPGIPNVEVKLSGTDAYGQAVSLTTRTDKDGKYQFNQLCAADYRVTVTASTVPAGLTAAINPSANGNDNNPVDSNEPAGTTVKISTDSSSNLTVDFGYEPDCEGSIGDRVWLDQNANGKQDAGEPGIPNVKVTLAGTNSYGLPVTKSVQTDSTGLYGFHGLCQGDYSVAVDNSTVPASFSPTASAGSSADDLVNDDSNNPAGTAVHLSSDATDNPSADFGYVPKCGGVIGDFVWKDLNSNGKQDAGEPGIENVEIKLGGTNAYGQLVSMSASTDASGLYTFNGLCAGSYTLTVNPSTVPSGWLATAPLKTDGNASVPGDATDSNAPTGTIVPLTGDAAVNKTVDFGYVPNCTATVGDFVWQDKNLNGIQDDGTGSGIDGVQVLLTGTNVYGQSVNVSDITKNGGYYQFSGLCQGNYTVAVNTASTAALGMVPTQPRSSNGNDGSGNDSNEPAGTSLAIATDSSSNQTLDFGFFSPAPALTAAETCANAASPDQPLTFSATVSNTGNEPLSAISCTDSLGTTQVIADLLPGATGTTTFSYTGSTSPLSDAVTCSAKGALSNSAVSSSSSTQSCSISTSTTLAVAEVCADAGSPAAPMTFSATVSNTGNETLTGVSCSDSLGSTQAVSDILPGATCSTTFSYTGSTSPLSDFVICSAKGAISKSAVSAASTAKSCNIITKTTLAVAEVCANAASPTAPMTFTASISNTGDEALTGVSCSDSLGSTQAVSDILPGASGSTTFSYTGSTSPLSDSVTCSAKGAISKSAVSAASSAQSCSISTSTTLAVAEICADAASPTTPMTFSATVNNTGNETLTGVSCSDSLGTTQNLSDILPGATGSTSFSYTGSTSPLSDSVTCSAKGAISKSAVSAASAAKSCNITTKTTLAVAEICANAASPTAPMTFTASISNTGNEALTGVSCTDSLGSTQTLSDILPGAASSTSFSYTGSTSPLSDSVTCSAKGAISKSAISAASSTQSCSITTKTTLAVAETCANAASPTAPMTFSATVSNTGNETLTGISCTDSLGTTQVIANILPGAAGFTSFSYTGSTSPLSDTVTCSAKGAISNTAVSALSSTQSCSIVTKPALSLVESCTSASSPGQPITLAATLTNSGNEPLTGISCSDSTGATVIGAPATLAAGATAALSSSYVPTASNSTDTITCKASGAINNAPVSSNASATCGILTKPAFFVIESCSNAPAPGQPINLKVFLTNSGNEALTGISCTDSAGAAITGAPAILAVGGAATLTGSYIPTTSSSTDTVTCKASGVINSALVTAAASSTCALLSRPGFSIIESCTNASGSGLPINLSATITNTGNETLTAFNCSDSKGATLTGIPASLGAGLTASLTGSYVPSGTNSTDTITCSAKGGIDNVVVSATSSSTCGIVTAACIQIKKQVSTNCSVTGAKDKHCKTDEVKTDYCKKSDCDSSYCTNLYQTKQTYCQEVTQKQAHCGSSESKPTYCAKTGCDQSYCGRNDLGKDDWCKIPAVPVCVPVWQDADTQDTAATMETATGSSSDSGDTLLGKLSSGTYSDQSSTWIKNLRHVTSSSYGENGDAHDADSNDDWYKSESDNKCNGSEYYQGNVRQQNLSYRFIVSNCGSTDLSNLVINDPKIAITNFAAGSLKAGSSVTLTSAQIPQLAQPKFYCNSSFVNTVTVSAVDSLNRSVSDSDDAWVLCNTKTCAFTQGYWKNHASSWPVASLKLGTISYTKNQLLTIFSTAPAGNGLISLAHQLIAAKLNVANGTIVPTSIQQAIASADALIGTQVLPPAGCGTSPSASTSALIQTLDSYNSGTLAGGPTHCGDAPPPTQLCTGSIGDYAWFDLNKNGIPAYGELGLAGIKITLSNGKSTTTDSAGHYLFTGLCAGTYLVKATPPCTFIATTSSSVSTTLTTDSSANLAVDFGFAKPTASCTGKIGDFVWNDLNLSGTQSSSEPGLSGVQITLSNGSTAVTDALGHYQFTGLCAGDYLVTVATPTGYTASAVAQGTDTTKDSKRSPAKVTLASNGSSVQNIDFGFYKTVAPVCTGVIGNYIWNDLNKNGIQDCTEKGIPGVAVTLSNGQSTLTDAEGRYQFSGLCAGTYTVSATTPVGFTPSPTLQGTSRAADSNANASSVVLTGNSGSDLSIDFGFWKLPTPTPSQSKGCSLGYWKNHSANWPTASHTVDNFDTVFAVNAFSPDINLLQALNTTGGGLSNLARQAAAALLNAEDSRISGYPMSANEIKAAVLNAILTGNYDCLASKLDSYNNLGCPLN